ncbi:MAG: HAD-IIB family hydrolase [Planctomycetaceae bacterium]|nr:HAD-IIB family hydrolase [Planctomycetaceae bacterium]
MTRFPVPRAIVFSDLDGCLLNHDYTYREAKPALACLRDWNVPVVLASSKTAAEMLSLAEALDLDTPIICENGGAIHWRGNQLLGQPDATVLGVPRPLILSKLSELAERFRFRSFTELGLEGIIKRTGLAPEQARRAAQRETTEPLVWDDDEAKIPEFQERLRDASLTLTRGGRFWHVAGNVTKGDGMQTVLTSYRPQQNANFQTLAIGDSPIDLPMLNQADWAIVVPQPNGEVRIQPEHDRYDIATASGSTGWNDSVLRWIERSFS